MGTNGALERLLGDVPACIHDGKYHGESKVHVDPDHAIRVTKGWCDGCGELLWISRHDLRTNEITRVTHDEVFDLLYTKGGRIRIVKAALEDSGWEMPEFWTPSTV